MTKETQIATDPSESSEELTPAPAEETREALLEAEVTELKDKLLRAVAETENIRRRAARDRQDGQKYGVSKLASSLISVVDNLERALKAVPEEGASEDALNLRGGVQATYDEFLSVLGAAGVTPVATEGVVFDPQLHEVMVEVPNEDVASGTILEEVSRGYMIHDRLLRPARVVVAKGSAQAKSSSVDVEA